jgi:hypothetical protein
LSWPFTELCQPRLSWKDWCRRELPSHWSHPAAAVKLSMYKYVKVASTPVDQHAIYCYMCYYFIYLHMWSVTIYICSHRICVVPCLSTASVLAVASCLWSQSLISLARRSAKQRKASGPRSRVVVKCCEVPALERAMRMIWYNSYIYICIYICVCVYLLIYLFKHIHINMLYLCMSITIMLINTIISSISIFYYHCYCCYYYCYCCCHY